MNGAQRLTPVGRHLDRMARARLPQGRACVPLGLGGGVSWPYPSVRERRNGTWFVPVSDDISASALC